MNIKKGLMIVVAVFVLTAAACSSSSTPSPTPLPKPTPTPIATIQESPTPEGFISYNSKANRFSIAYPSEWETVQETEDGLSFSARLPESAEGNMFGLQVENRPWYEGHNSLDYLAEASFDALASTLESFYMHSMTKTSLRGYEVVILDSEGVEPLLKDNVVYRLLSLIVRDNDSSWLVSCISPADDYDQRESDFRSILYSFRVPGME